MTKLSQIWAKKSGKAALVAIIAILAVPALAFCSEKKIFVDSDASGKQDGSYHHPYSSIDEAMDHADKGTRIYLAKGEYKENITIKEGVSLFGNDDRDKVVIKAKNDDKPVVTMEGNTQIDKVTIKDGEEGIRVKDDGRAKITNCIIKNNDNDGINIEGDKAWPTREVTIYGSQIKDNGRAGIFGKARKYVIMDNEIEGNDEHGIRLLGGVDAWVYGNHAKFNSLDGMKFDVSYSSIWMKNNRLEGNKSNGVELYLDGAKGSVNIQKTKFINNARYAIAKVQPVGAINQSLWSSYLTFNGLPNEFWGNGLGNISPVLIGR